MPSVLVEWDAAETVTVRRLPYDEAERRRAWDAVAERYLTPWAAGQVEVDDDLMPPTVASLRTAERLVQVLRDSGKLPPTDVLPNGDGGVLFENRDGRASVQLEVLRDGSAEVSHFGETGFVSAEWFPASDFA